MKIVMVKNTFLLLTSALKTALRCFVRGIEKRTMPTQNTRHFSLFLIFIGYYDTAPG
tara:strand:- start:4492 stop:4662 length:171 start_codon:yes stop_codon:yes gene_type:complete